jgi:hypothetical protein
MSWAKIHFPTHDDEVYGFYQLVRHTRVVSYNEGAVPCFKCPPLRLGGSANWESSSKSWRNSTRSVQSPAHAETESLPRSGHLN